MSNLIEIVAEECYAAEFPSNISHNWSALTDSGKTMRRVIAEAAITATLQAMWSSFAARSKTNPTLGAMLSSEVFCFAKVHGIKLKGEKE